MPSIVTRFRFGDTPLEIAQEQELKITVEQVIAVLREKESEWNIHKPRK